MKKKIGTRIIVMLIAMTVMYLVSSVASGYAQEQTKLVDSSFFWIALKNKKRVLFQGLRNGLKWTRTTDLTLIRRAL